MRKSIFLIIIFVTVLSKPLPAEEPVDFADANLKAAVETELGINDPTPTDMLELTNLTSPRNKIRDLTGLEYAINLQSLNLNNNEISNISALSGLTSLQDLHLGENEISDISPLSGLTNLKVLVLYYNHNISDISPLSELTSLVELWLSGNQILLIYGYYFYGAIR
jgi:internalin A